MKLNKLITAITITVFTFLFSFAQETESTNSLKEGTLTQQFDYIARISSNYRDKGKRYEVINQEYFQGLKSNVLDSINKLESKISESNATISLQQKTNLSLQTELEETKATLETTNSEKDKISLFGIQLSKGFYNMLLWSVIGVLLLLLFSFIYKFKSSNSITKAAKKSLADIELEFEDHRRNALEREQKVRRQLQDEINKQKANN